MLYVLERRNAYTIHGRITRQERQQKPKNQYIFNGGLIMTTAERIKTLQKERDIAYSEYYKLAIKPSTNPSKSDLEPLEKAIARYEAICEELNQIGTVEEV